MSVFILYFITSFTCSIYGSYRPEIKYIYLFNYHILFCIYSTDFRIRLTGGSRRSEGRLEVFWDGSWGTVCDDSFHHRDASVVCHSLGYTGSSQFYPMARFGEGNDQIWMDEVQCTGSEATLDQCAHTGFGNHDCEHSEDVGIKCQLPDISREWQLYHVMSNMAK